MTELITLPGDPPIELTLRPSARARRLSLRVSRLDGRVTMSVPKSASRREALDFAHERAGWIRKHLDGRPSEIQPLPGGTILFKGRKHNLIATGGRAARIGDGVIDLPLSAPEKTGARLAALFKVHARASLQEATERHATKLGRQFGRITLRDTRSRWGSCSHAGDLMYSWRLIMTPPPVLDYVAGHEVAHLVEMNHSPAFWAVVDRLCPDYQPHRKWLRDHGVELHRYRFRN